MKDTNIVKLVINGLLKKINIARNVGFVLPKMERLTNIVMNASAVLSRLGFIVRNVDGVAYKIIKIVV